MSSLVEIINRLDNNIVGIYKITSPSGKIYIGQSINIKKRFREYKNLNRGKQRKLENSFSKYGTDNHQFDIFHICEQTELNNLEERYITELKCCETGLNIRGGGNAKGKTSEETKEILRKINLGKKYSDEVNKSKGRKGNKPYHAGKHLSEAHKKSLSMRFSKSGNPKFGKPMDTHHKEKLLLINIGKIISEKHKQKISETFKGKPKSIEQKIRMSLAAKGIKKSNEAIEKSRLSRIGIKRTVESRMKQSARTKSIPKTLSQKTNSGNGIRQYWKKIKQERLTMIF